MPLNFTAIDFETANRHSASACSVGLVKVTDGRIVDRTSWFIRPPLGYDEFSEWNTRIHGIVAADVRDALLWSEQLGDIVRFVGGDVLVAHNAGFDMSVIRAACSASYLDIPVLPYLCSLQLARKTYSLDSYRLPVAALAAGFEDFRHHDALSDAEACATIVLHAAARHGADSIGELAALSGVRLSSIGAAPAPRPASPGDAHRAMVFS